MSKAFDEFRSEMEANESEQQREIQNLNENFKKEVNELAETTKELIKQKAKSDPAQSENRQKFLALLEQYTSNMLDGSDMAAKSITVNRSGADSMIVSMKMSTSPSPTSSSSSTHNLSKSKLRQMAAAAAKNRCGKGTKMTVTTLMGQSNGVHRKMIITNRKSTTISISGVTIERGSPIKEPKVDANTDDNISGEIDAEKSSGKFYRRFDLISSKNIENCDFVGSSGTVLKFVKYRCVHCHDVKHWIETFNALKDVYAHWLSAHTDLAALKPFQYYVIENVSCHHCSTPGTHYELVKHHKNSHPSLQFAIVSQINRQQCALCPYSGDHIIAHFQTMHKFILKTLSARHLRCIDVPFRLSNAQVDAHLNQQLHKKQKCGNCNAIFDTDRELRDHHSKNHNTQKLTIKEFYDSINYHLICNCCKLKIDRYLYLNHIEHCATSFSCHKCTFHTNDMVKLVQHDRQAHMYRNTFIYRCMQYKNRLKRDYLKTRVIFGNGLVLTKQNLLLTKYDDSKQFDVFIDKLLEIKKERYNRENEK